jgi:hypothetical protein
MQGYWAQQHAHHLYCYNKAVLHRHLFGHFDEMNPEHPFKKIACTKQCYCKARIKHGLATVDPETRNIPWNKDGRLGTADLKNNSENILLAWIRHPGNIYAKFHYPPSGMTKVSVCEEIALKIQAMQTIKISTPVW